MKTSGFDDAIKHVEGFCDRVKRAAEKTIKDLTDYAAKWANEEYNIAEYDGIRDVVVTADPVQTDTKEVKGGVTATGTTVAFIEFGTGITFPDNHPKSAELGAIRGQYGQGKGSNPKGWVYRGEPGPGTTPVPNREGLYRTHGNPASRTMYYTAESIRETVLGEFMENFNNDRH